MGKIVTTELMREIDAAAIASGIPSLVLMERAGEALADAVIKKIEPSKGKVVVAAGGGNNAGDGLVAARHLINAGYDVEVFLFAETGRLSPDARANWEVLATLTTNIFQIFDEGTFESAMLRWTGASCFIDALFGTGLSKPPNGLYLRAISALNRQKAFTISADVPSGLDSNRGVPFGDAVKADMTVTFGFPKLGFYLGRGAEFTGEVKIVDIGIPALVSDKHESPYWLIDQNLVREKMPKRARLDHKGTYGHVLVIAGSKARLGAGYLSSLGALRTGCGLVTFALPKTAFQKFDSRYAEIMPYAIIDDDSGVFTRNSVDSVLQLAAGKDAVVLGPALDVDRETIEFVHRIISKIDAPLVLDADGLNAIAGKKSGIASRKFPTILTPHPGEMARLLQTTTSAVQEERLSSGVKLARAESAIVVLKGAGTIVTDGKQVLINPTGNSGMATAGSGDVLSGMIASLLAQKVEPIYAAAIAVYAHGLAGDHAAKRTGQRGMVASDIINSLTHVWREVEHDE